MRDVRLQLCLILDVFFAVQRRPPGVAGALGSPLIGHDGRLIACSEKKSLVAFERNGSIAWMVTLGHTCKEGISPVAERDEVIN